MSHVVPRQNPEHWLKAKRQSAWRKCIEWLGSWHLSFAIPRSHICPALQYHAPYDPALCHELISCTRNVNCLSCSLDFHHDGVCHRRHLILTLRAFHVHLNQWQLTLPHKYLRGNKAAVRQHLWNASIFVNFLKPISLAFWTFCLSIRLYLCASHWFVNVYHWIINYTT